MHMESFIAGKDASLESSIASMTLKTAIQATEITENTENARHSLLFPVHLLGEMPALDNP